MLIYIIRRLVLSIPILLLVTIMVFSLLHVIPGDPVTVLLGEEASPELKEALRRDMGLDRPLVVQYSTWLGNVLRGDLGRSLVHRTPVIDQIKVRLPVTLELTIGSFLIAILIALPAGVLSAVHRGSTIDYISRLLAIGGQSIPSFWIGIMFILLFAVKLRWLPASGYVPLTEDLRGNLAAMLMPMLATGIREAAVLTRMLRSSLLEILHTEYVVVARSKGLSEWLVIVRHALRNALIPVITSAGLLVAGLLGGLVITETIFAIPGFGRLIVEAIYQRDFMTVQGAILVSALLVVLVNLMVDLLYVMIDPRIKLAQKG